MRNVKVYQELSQDASMFLRKQGISKYKDYCNWAMVYFREKCIQSNRHFLSEKIQWMILFREQLIFPTQLMKMNKYKLFFWIIFLSWKQDNLTKRPPCLKMEIPQKLCWSQNTTTPVKEKSVFHTQWKTTTGIQKRVFYR